MRDGQPIHATGGSPEARFAPCSAPSPQGDLVMTLSNYRPDIDGLRAVAVLAVVLNHLSASWVPGGYVGVDVFYVISGYLITRIIRREMAEGRFTFIGFYERRARRIFPALFAVLAVTLVAGWFVLLPSDYLATLRATLGTLFFSSNMVFWRDLAEGYFAPDAKLNPLLHTWSLGVEEQFYVFFPLLLLGGYRYARKQIFWILLGCALASLLGAALLLKGHSVAVFFLAPFRAWELFAGALLALGVVPAVRRPALRHALAAAGLAAVLLACFGYGASTPFPGIAALLPVLGAAAIIHAGASGPTWAGRLLQWRPVVYIGLISYSLYLWHWPLVVLAQYVNGMGPLTPYLPSLLLASLLLGSLSYHYIEQPFRRQGRLTQRQFVFSTSAASMVVLALLAGVGVMKDGYAARFDATVVKLDQARVPPIPYKQCDGRTPLTWCTLGRPEGPVTMLLWGDSHMLQWAAALQTVLAEEGQRAVLASASYCPPMFDVESSVKQDCGSTNLAVKNYLLTHREVHTVVMTGRWLSYFQNGSVLAETRDQSSHGVTAAERALAATLQWLRQHGRRVIVIGPVPEYDKSVPLALAQEAITGRRLLRSSAADQREKYEPFFKVVAAVSPGPIFRYLDPIQWFCRDDCVTMKDSVSLYRDSNHLSVAGAMEMETELRRGLTN